jgi:hypothetical protein
MLVVVEANSVPTRNVPLYLLFGGFSNKGFGYYACAKANRIER